MKKQKKIFFSIAILFTCFLFTSCTVNNSPENNIFESYTLKDFNQIDSSITTNQYEIVYDQKLQEFYSEYNKRYSSPQKIHYDIFDLDGDNIPELIISEGNFHAAGCKVYSYVNSELVELGRLGEWGKFSFFPKSRLLLFAWTNQGHYIAKWYQIENHEMKFLYSYGYWWKERDVKQYEIDGKSTTEEEYDQYLKEHSDKRPYEDEERVELGSGRVYQE